MNAKKAVKDFLVKINAIDELPDEVIDAACEMAESVADEEIKEEIKEEVKDEDIEKKIEKVVKDAISNALLSSGLVKDSSMNALDEVFKEFEEEEEEVDDAENEESVTVDPKEIKDSGADIRKIITDVKPYIASIKDEKTRKRIADSFAKLAKTSKTTTSAYSGIASAVINNKRKNASDAQQVASISDDYGVGGVIASKFNPHYKEGGK